MRVGQAQPFQQALHAAILAPAPVQRVEDHVGGYLGEARAEIGGGVDLDHRVSCLPKGCGAFTP